jgi:hypothetical protein
LEMGALDLTAWRNRFERGYGHVVWQTKKWWMIMWIFMSQYSCSLVSVKVFK